MTLDSNIFSGGSIAPVSWWLGTLAWFLLLILGDLYLNRKDKSQFSFKTAIIRSLVWISLGLLLGVVIWLNFGAEAGGRYFAGFLIEKSLSADNIFVWGVILTFFSIPKKYHYKVLFWGILGAIVFRSVFVVGGLTVIGYFHPALMLLGVGLLWLSYKMLAGGDGSSFNPKTSRIIKFVRRLLPLSQKDHAGRLFVLERGKIMVTMLFLTVCVIELTDILFAMDSVPAAMAVACDPYLVLSSNIAAILGLRSLYFVYERLEDKFYLLNKALALILSVIGITLILEPSSVFGLPWFGIEIPPALSLGFVIIVLSSAIGASLMWPKAKNKSKAVDRAK